MVGFCVFPMIDVGWWLQTSRGQTVLYIPHWSAMGDGRWASRNSAINSSKITVSPFGYVRVGEQYHSLPLSSTRFTNHVPSLGRCPWAMGTEQNRDYRHGRVRYSARTNLVPGPVPVGEEGISYRLPTPNIGS
jgi:hypothetical protein